MSYSQWSCRTHVVTFRLYRYLRLIVNCISHWTFRPIPLPEDPTLTSQDVTIIVPTLGGNWNELRETLTTFLRTDPFQIILVTTDANLKHADQTVMSMQTSRVRVLSITHANKRRQMCCAIPEVQTRVTVFADDDVIWPQKILPWILAPFEKPRIGGVGTCQRLRRVENPNLWNFLGALYLERRNFDISATTHIDGGLPCLSGRTVAYRTHILQDPDFTYGFTHERWLHRYQLNADDDNFITRWMVSHGWDTYVQYCKEAEVKTTLEGNHNFLKQCLRWVRSNWRSNLTSMFRERYVWRSVSFSQFEFEVGST
ncbi:MAG: Type 2 glycosyltransferase [Candelina submexicana]|nr:MAG: Type 2 glycosyltransferase [Candelina submexicana]